jgi:hypothetical protein
LKTAPLSALAIALLCSSIVIAATEKPATPIIGTQERRELLDVMRVACE